MHGKAHPISIDVNVQNARPRSRSSSNFRDFSLSSSVPQISGVHGAVPSVSRSRTSAIPVFGLSQINVGGALNIVRSRSREDDEKKMSLDDDQPPNYQLSNSLSINQGLSHLYITGMQIYICIYILLSYTNKIRFTMELELTDTDWLLKNGKN